jgi:hypothetical protein
MNATATFQLSFFHTEENRKIANGRGGVTERNGNRSLYKITRGRKQW